MVSTIRNFKELIVILHSYTTSWECFYCYLYQFMILLLLVSISVVYPYTGLLSYRVFNKCSFKISLKAIFLWSLFFCGQLGLADKNMLNYDFDLVPSDTSDANTNNITLFSDDTDERSRKSTNPDVCGATRQEYEVNVIQSQITIMILQTKKLNTGDSWFFLNAMINNVNPSFLWWDIKVNLVYLFYQHSPPPWHTGYC